MRTFVGTSPNGDLAEALKAAILHIPAPRPPGHSDSPVSWTVEKISGKRGASAIGEVSVIISAEDED
jgi:hypothetical protein